jgi:hypothetical protein
MNRFVKVAEKVEEWGMKVAPTVAASGPFVKLVEGSLERRGFAVLVGHDFGAESMPAEVVAWQVGIVAKKAYAVVRAVAKAFPALTDNKLEVDVMAQPNRGLVLKCWLMFSWTDGGGKFKRTPLELSQEIEAVLRRV